MGIVGRLPAAADLPDRADIAEQLLEQAAFAAERRSLLVARIDPGDEFQAGPLDPLDIAGFVEADVEHGLLGWRGHGEGQLARIGRYYATESMLVWDAQAGRYDADATPSTGSDTIWAYCEELVRGTATVERGDHAVF